MQVVAVLNTGWLRLYRNPESVILKSLLISKSDSDLDADTNAAKIVPLDEVGTLSLLELGDAQPTE